MSTQAHLGSHHNRANCRPHRAIRSSALFLYLLFSFTHSDYSTATVPKSASLEFAKLRDHAFALADKFKDFATLALLVDRDQSRELIDRYTSKVVCGQPFV